MIFLLHLCVFLLVGHHLFLLSLQFLELLTKLLVLLVNLVVLLFLLL